MDNRAAAPHYCSARASPPRLGWNGASWPCGCGCGWKLQLRLIKAHYGTQGPSTGNLDEEDGTWLKMVAWGIWIYSTITNNQWQYPTNNKHILYSGLEACVARLKTCSEDGLLQEWELHSSAHTVVFPFPLWKHTEKSRARVLLVLRLPQIYLSLTWEKIYKPRSPLQRANVLKTHMCQWVIELESINAAPMWGKAQSHLLETSFLLQLILMSTGRIRIISILCKWLCQPVDRKATML